MEWTFLWPGIRSSHCPQGVIRSRHRSTNPFRTDRARNDGLDYVRLEQAAGLGKQLPQYELRRQTFLAAAPTSLQTVGIFIPFDSGCGAVD